MKRKIIVWFRNDLRLLDNEAFCQAIADADEIIPIYCIDPRHFSATKFGFPKTGAFRAQFLLESLQDLKFRLQDMGGDLIIRSGKPEEVLFALAKFHNIDAIYCYQEATSEEIGVEDALIAHLTTIPTDITFFWGSTLYHYDDLPFDVEDLPDIFTKFRKKVEAKIVPRTVFSIPEKVVFNTEVKSATLPTLKQLGLSEPHFDERAVLKFKGGETQALLRLKHYLWEGNYVQFYKETRNELLGGDYSSKFSPWLANGCISSNIVYNEIKKYEKQVIKNDSTYWLIFELIWRDYFRFIAMKYGSDIFKIGGIKQQQIQWDNNQQKFEKWCQGQTGIPFIDANMRELNQTGFMSNRGRQNAASFLVKDMNINWLQGAAYFESLLIDYDPCSNYGNWNYIAGIGNDPRENRYFNVLTQAKRYDPDGLYVKYWCPELKTIPSSRIHEPYLLNKTEQKYLGVTLGKNYPFPCIDINKWRARKAAKTRFKKGG